MTLPFPTIRAASTRNVKPGSHPVREFKAMNGAVTKIVHGDRVTDALVSFEYPYILDDEAALVVQLWYDSLSGAIDVALPANAFVGVDPGLAAKVPSYLSWFMSEPDVRSVQGKPGWSRLSFELRGQLVA
jgi:hypothetical protein